MIESLLESKEWQASFQTGTISIVSGAKAVVGVGTLFTTELSVGDLIEVTDDNGDIRYGEVDTITDALNMDLKYNFPSAVTGKAYAKLGTDEQSLVYFVGDNTVLKKEPENFPTSKASILYVANSRSQISKNEGLRLKSFYTRLPYQYTYADGNGYVAFKYMDANGVELGTVDSIGEIGFLNIPIENTEIPLEAFIPCPAQAGITLATETWQLSMFLSVGPISQVDAPDVLNGQYLPIFGGVRVVHANQALT